MKYQESYARISEDGKYRYALTRIWDRDRLPVCFVMLNPSTADAEEDDPTIRRCVSFAKREQHGGLIVVNLFAYRATEPKALLSADDPVGPENDLAIQHLCHTFRTVFAWGAERWPLVRRRSAAVRGMLTPPFSCLGVTRDGHPRHPLYLSGATRIVEWPAREGVAT